MVLMAAGQQGGGGQIDIVMSIIGQVEQPMRAFRVIAQLTIVIEAGRKPAIAYLGGDRRIGGQVPGFVEERIGGMAARLAVMQVVVQNIVESRCGNQCGYIRIGLEVPDRIEYRPGNRVAGLHHFGGHGFHDRLTQSSYRKVRRR